MGWASALLGAAPRKAGRSLAQRKARRTTVSTFHSIHKTFFDLPKYDKQKLIESLSPDFNRSHAPTCIKAIGHWAWGAWLLLKSGERASQSFCLPYLGRSKNIL